MHKIADRYAKALLQRATEEDLIDQIYEDMRYVRETCATHPALRYTLSSPLASHQQKLALLQTLFHQKVHTLTLQLFGVVTKKHREVLLSTIAQAFMEGYEQQQGIALAMVTTATPLSEQLIKKLEQVVRQITAAHQVRLTQHLDPNLIGGYVLQVGDQRLDCSVRGKLNKLRSQYITHGY